MNVFNLSPDMNQSKDWIELACYGDVESLRKTIDTKDLPKEIQYEDGSDDVLAYFKQEVDFDFSKGGYVGEIAIFSGTSLSALVHECAHAGLHYAMIATEANLAKGAIKNRQHELEFFHECVATSIESIFSDAIKKCPAILKNTTSRPS